MKIKKAVILTVASVIFLRLFLFSASAGEYSIEDLKDHIPSDVLSVLPEDVFSEDTEKSAASVAKTSDFSFVAEFVFNAFSIVFPKALSSFFSILGIVVINSVAKLLSKNTKSASVLSAFEICSSLCIATIVFGVQYDLLSAAEEYLRELSFFMGGMVPLMSAIYASGGNISGAVVNSTGISIFLFICESVCMKVLLPLVKICYALSMAGMVSDAVKISSITKLINKNAALSLSFTALLVSSVMSYQSVLAQGADSTASKIIKFSLGTFIPVVGGAMGDSVKTLSSGLNLIKNTTGVLGIVLIAFMVLPLLINLFLHKISLGAAASVAELLGCEKEKNFLHDVAGVQNLIIAILAISSLMFIVAISLFIKTTLVIGA